MLLGYLTHPQEEKTGMRIPIRWISAAALASCLAARPATAQIEKGDKSLGFQTMLVSATGEEPFTFGLGVVGFNYYVTRNLSWRLGVVAIRVEGGDVKTTVTGLSGGVEWNFGQAGAKTVPFIAVDASQIIAENANATGIEASAGFRKFISRSTSFDVVGAYSTNLTKDDSGSTGGQINVRFGFTFYFAKDRRS